MPFALTWWSLTFPVGTFVTGTTQLAVHTGLPAFRVAAAIAYVGLLTTWCLVAVRTFRGGLRGNIFAPPSADPDQGQEGPARRSSGAVSLSGDVIMRGASPQRLRQGAELGRPVWTPGAYRFERLPRGCFALGLKRICRSCSPNKDRGRPPTPGLTTSGR